MLAVAQPLNGAFIYDLTAVNDHGPAKDITGLDFFVVVSETADQSQVRFEFHNDGSTGIISSIYFERGVLADIAAIDVGDQEGVEFVIGAHPGNLPGHNISSSVDQDFTVSAKPPRKKTGVGPDEWVAIIFDLQPDKTFTDLISQIDNSDLRFAVRAQGVPSDVVIVNQVPEPATLAIVALGIMLLRVVKH
jgi:hypothetical protein